jgi:alpha-D-xyloside xylohydrolase
MKFTDGFWLLRDGVSALHATHLQKVEQSRDGFKALVAPKVVEHRGATLNSALFDVEFSSPASDVIGVRVRHHRGGADSLSFDLNLNQGVTTFSESDSQVSYTSGALTAKLSKGSSFNLDSWQITE